MRRYFDARPGLVGAVVLAAVCAAPLRAQDRTPPTTGAEVGKVRRTLTLDDYAGWKRIQGARLALDGRWVSYAFAPNTGDDTLFVRSLGADTRHAIPRGTQLTFSGDSRWAAYLVNPPSREGGAGGRGAVAGAGGRGSAPEPRALQLLDLTTGQVHEIPHVASFQFSNDARYFAVLRSKSDREAQHDGADLVLRDLRSGLVQSFGNVDEYAFDDSGARLAWTVDAAGQTGNGMYVLDLRTSTMHTLDAGIARYERLTWSESGTALAVLRGTKPDKQKHRANQLIIVANVATSKATTTIFDPSQDAAFPAEMVLSELSALTWSDDGNRIFVGIKQQEAEPEESKDRKANVDVWHWKDDDVQSVQQVRAEANRRFTYAAVFNVASRQFVRLADDDMRTVTPTDGRWAIGRNDVAYRDELSWGGGRADYVRIDLDSGERETMVRGLRRTLGPSPNGKWFLYFQDSTLFVRDIATGQTTDLSALAGTSFVDADDDHPYELPSYGLAGWTADGRHLIANHRFDLWLLPLDGKGKAVNLTQGVGERERIRFRIVRLDAEQRTIDTSKPIFLSSYGDRSKKSGYHEVRAGSAPRALLFDDMAIASLQKADSANTFLFTKQTFEEFPDLWVSGQDLAAARKITDANPQREEYAWGRRILIDYTDARGNELQATLALPANYEPGKRYPMLVYFYEKMSQNHHIFSMPVYDDRPHMSTYASDGYLVLQPDIVYEIGRPGSSALDDVGSAVRKVIELGYADPERIGLQGHSWGGYQSSFIVTQTDLFAAVVTGAPPTNLVSFYNELYKSTGTVQQGITEIGQVRMGDGATPWTAHELYESQSPVHQAENITTPFLILHGTEDGAVDWHQGLEFYNAARRLGKQVILLSYPGEGHHLGRKENQIDFQVRMKQYFDHYLKGTPAPKWMTDGVPHLQKEMAGARE
jgi:dipeptidyl aminopeptidase/acylaminoacyl peptidase